jgi:NTE family protein
MRKGGSALASYLLFDQQYCRALIQMGYENTIKRRDELSVFFDPAASPPSMEIPAPHCAPDVAEQTAAVKC